MCCLERGKLIGWCKLLGGLRAKGGGNWGGRRIWQTGLLGGIQHKIVQSRAGIMVVHTSGDGGLLIIYKCVIFIRAIPILLKARKPTTHKAYHVERG